MTELDVREYWENRLRKEFGLHGVGYARLGRQYNNWLYKIRKTVFLSRARKACQDFRDTSALDIGCGTGFYIERWKELGVKNIVGVDITKVAIENMRKQFPDCEFHQMDISDNIYSFAETQFDFISAFDVLFHIIDDRRFEIAICNIHSLLKENGLLLWSDNFLHGDTIRGSNQVSRSLASIENLLHTTGLQIFERRPMFYLMNAPVDIPSYPLMVLWRIISSIVSKAEVLGFTVGALLYPLELLLTSTAKESPTTEIMICRKS